jgi:hypothetical protein
MLCPTIMSVLSSQSNTEKKKDGNLTINKARKIPIKTTISTLVSEYEGDKLSLKQFVVTL